MNFEMQRENDVGIFLIGGQHSDTRMLENIIAGMSVSLQTAVANQATNNHINHHVLQQNRVVSVATGPDIRNALERASNSRNFASFVKHFIDIMIGTRRFIVFIIVLQFGVRISEEDIKAMVEFVTAVLGESLLECHTFIAMTGGEIFQRDHGDWQTRFPNWCQNQQAGYLRNLMENCQWRVHLFGDMGRDEDGLQQQLQNLLNSIDQLRHELGERAYSRHRFDLAADTRTRAIVDSRKWNVDNETNENLERILPRLRRIRSRMSPTDQLQQLELLKSETAQLVDFAKEEDCNTGILTLTIARAELVSRSVCDAIDVCKNDIQSESRIEANETRVQRLFMRQARITNLLIFIGGLVFFLYCDMCKCPSSENGHEKILLLAWIVIFLLCLFKRVKFNIHICALVLVMIAYWFQEDMHCLRAYFDHVVHLFL